MFRRLEQMDIDSINLKYICVFRLLIPLLFRSIEF